MVDIDEFAAQTAQYRRELLAHCYRMVGSVDDAEDLVQETMLRAWRGYREFEGRASMRTWLYRIATNACLNALQHSSRRVLPSGLSGPSDDPETVPLLSSEIPWLQPMPDVRIEPESSDPAAIVAAREGMRLALIAVWQYLPPRQRAVLILRDVLRWKASEVAELLEVSVTAVNSTLQRAHTTLRQTPPASADCTEPDDPAVRAVLDRYAVAFENADMVALTELLKTDAVMEMPPIREWFRGNLRIVRLIATRCPARAGDVRMVRTAANGQPAFGFYLRGEAHSIHVLTATPTGIERIVSFHDSGLFEGFDLPKSLS
ncbi:sigma-70 family RNA polymerase sigma factor [Nocardia sp. NPDC051463]|uniref:sigma-70 family RNA polymerase sigma factor n=1 Tax=Nocardia sp. NPDC051463 TaxID=3154845 RepID=UPI0034504386